MNSTDYLYAKLISCARINTLYTIPSIVILSWLLVALHNAEMHTDARLTCAAIGLLFGWCMALWGAALLASEYTKVLSDPSGLNTDSASGVSSPKSSSGTAEQSTPTGKQEKNQNL